MNTYREGGKTSLRPCYNCTGRLKNGVRDYRLWKWKINGADMRINMCVITRK